MWLGEHQAQVIEYQRAENAALLERSGKRRLQLTDGERRRLARLGKTLGRKALQQVATIATPDTILRWSCADTGGYRTMAPRRESCLTPTLT